MREELKRFADLQEAALKRNDNKRHWKNYSNMYLFNKLKAEIKELEAALINGSTKYIEQECAYVGNYAMMLADNAYKFGKKVRIS